MPRIDREFVEKMADVLSLYAKPYNARHPVVALDERPTMLRESARVGCAVRPGRPKRTDYEYRRRGTANVFCIVEPKAGRHLTHATKNRKADAFVRALQKIARRYRTADRIHLVLDNLNIHGPASVLAVLGSERGRALVRRFRFHHTPKHASWLNVAELEASLFSRECLGRDRIPGLPELKRRTAAWNRDADRRRRAIQWTFTIDDAKRVFGKRWFNRLLTEH